MRKIWFYILASGLVLSCSAQLSAQTNTSKNPDPSANNVSPILNHTVKKGETYYSLSKQYKTTVKALQELNPDFPVLKTGAVIKVKPATSNADGKVPIEGAPTSTSTNTQSNASSSNVVGNGNAGTTVSSASVGGSSSSVITQSTNSASTTIGKTGNGNSPAVKNGNSNSVSSATAISKSTSAQDSIKRIKEAARVERTNLLLASDLDKAAVVVTVLSGETLYSLSKKYGISVDRIKNLNDLESDNLQVGQVLVLPPEARKNTTVTSGNGLNSSGGTDANSVNTQNLTTSAVDTKSNNSDLQSQTQQVEDKPVIIPNNAIAPNPVILSQKDSVANVQNGKTATSSSTTVKNTDGNKRDAGGMPELGAKKKIALKEYEKNVKVSVGQTGMDPERHWVLANNHKNGEVVALVNPDTKTIVWCVVMGPAKGKPDSEIIISESLSRKLNVDTKKSKLIFRYAAP